MDVVVDGDAGGGFASKFQADPRQSIIEYIDGNQNGLIYLETGIADDDHDLENIYTLREVDFLNGRFDAYGDVVDDMIRLISIATGFEAHEASRRVS